MTSEKPAQKFRTNDLGSVSDWMKQILNQSEALLSFPSLRSMIRTFQARLLHLICQNFSRVLKPQAETRVLLLSMSRSLSQ